MILNQNETYTPDTIKTIREVAANGIALLGKSGSAGKYGMALLY